MDKTVRSPAMNLVIVRHPEVGDESRGIEACSKIRKELFRKTGPVMFLHDASAMRTAARPYIAAFRRLGGCLPGRHVEHVLIAPNASARVMAHILSMFSVKNLVIFNNRADAVVYLTSKGISIEDVVALPQETVSVIPMAA